jgi:thiol-disulfide isomerase/thioredoxin
MNLNKFNFRRIFSRRLFAGLIGIILLTAAILKAYDIELFMRQIRDYQIITGHLMLIISAWGLIITEFVLGAALLVYFCPKITVPLSIALFCVFIGATLWAWITGVTEDCGCFGSWVKRSPSGAMIEDLIMLGILFLSWPGRNYQSSGGSHVKPLIVTAALLAGIILPMVFGTPVKELVGIGKGEGASQEDLFTAQGLKDVDLGKGSFIFVIIGTDCSHCRDSVEDFNRLAKKTDLPKVIALSADPEDEIDLFIEELEPVFPVLKITEDDFYRLLGMGSTPRSMLVVKQHVINTWDEEVPDAAVIREALGK